MSAFVELPYYRRRSSIDIRGQSVGSDILVALWDRPYEMAALAKRNAKFYEALEHYVKETKGKDAWDQFGELVYCSRDEVPDKEWMIALAEYLGDHPVFWSKFKESVGYSEDNREEEQEQQELEGYHHQHYYLGMFQGERQFYEQHRRGSNASSHLFATAYERHPTSPCSQTIAEEEEEEEVEEEKEEKEKEEKEEKEEDNTIWIALRDYPNIQTQLIYLKPEFFKRARQLMEVAPCSTVLSSAARRNSVLEDQDVDVTMEHGEPRFQTCGEGQADPYERFYRVSCTTRRQQPDDEAWIEELSEALDGWPELTEALKDVIDEVLPAEEPYLPV
ncbi:hypothetical protein DFQ28_002074 [Apophysomyces sp. BC1034]|nr:hypothetical protein DFQ30_002483 [Apophysomyces sp. BC1015]KAG0179880.1 hypothetical protein DFQ29_001533 [Apophysomyces sp. BC1021]KAG0190405.1 hypothetical protein DFQ28_002074 [Apophysomyces sp. BC1034]